MWKLDTRKQALIGGAALAIVATMQPAPAAAQTAAQEYDIPAQDLAKALQSFSRISDRELLFSTDVTAGKRSNTIRGRHSSEEALRILLKGTGLRVNLTNTGALLVARGELEGNSAASLGGVASDRNSSEIVVTAQKKLERLQDVPVPVSVISASRLSGSNQVRLQEYYTSVPGFSVSPTPSAGGQQAIVIRGITTGFNTNPTVGITIDDVPYGASNFQAAYVPDVDPADLERIEVLRGPQGTLYGASSMGGLLKFVTIEPNVNRTSGRIEGGLSSVHNGQGLGYSFRGSANVPISDAFAVRASGFTRRDAGYIDDPVHGLDGVNEQRVSGGRVAALVKILPAISLKVSALYQRSEGEGSNDVELTPGLGDLQQNKLLETGGYSRRIQAYSAVINADLGGATLTALTGYNVNRASDSLDDTFLLSGLANAFFAPATGASVISDFRTRKFSQEVRLASVLGSKFEWLIGGFYTRETNPNVQQVLAVNEATGVPSGLVLQVNQRAIYKEYAAFGGLTYHFTDRFDVQLGVRDSEIRQQSDTDQSGPLFPTGLLDGPLLKNSANAFTYLVTPRFRFSSDLMAYARLASGYRAGGANGNINSTVPKEFGPDKTRNYELGLKGALLNRALTFDLSLYYIDWKGLQLNLTDSATSLQYTLNAGRAKSTGVELSVEVRPAAGLTISAWGSYSDAALTRSLPANSAVLGDDGDRLPYSSRYSGSASVNQDFDITEDMTVYVGATLAYVGNRLGNFTSAAIRTRFPAYTRIDARAGFKFHEWDLSFYVNNFTDKRGVLGGGLGTFPPYARSYIQPRTIGTTLVKRF